MRCGLVMKEKPRYTLKQNVVYWLTGIGIVIGGTLVIGFVMLCLILIAIPTE
jgi:hypothetical protein